MNLSVIIPAYNCAPTLRECLEACLEQDYPAHEIIVVDDGSTDDTRELAQSIQGVKVVWQENAGPAAARNRGAEEATGHVYVMTDSDCVPAPDWLGEIFESLSVHEEWVAVGGTYTIANPESRLARIIQAEIEVRHSRFREEVDFLGSFNVAYRNDAFDAVGGFDTSYPCASGEDNDLAYRLQDASGILGFNIDAKVAHYHPEKTWAYLKTQFGHGYWRMKLYKDHKNRSKGDNYASLSELISIPFALMLTVLLIPALVALYFAPVLFWVYMFALFIQSFLHFNMQQTLGESHGFQISWLFGQIAVYRDYARALGMAKGILHFHLLGKNT